MAHSPLTLSHLTHRAERHGRWTTTGRARAAVFGLSDGLVSNLSLVAGVSGASTASAAVLVGGIAGLVAGALSMASGEYVSMQANRELLERELDIERREIEADPAGETLELAGIYADRGIDTDAALSMANRMMADPNTALEAHARDELGIDPTQLGSPIGAAVASFLAFAVGAAIPVLPWFFVSGTAGVVTSLVLGILAAAILGASVGLVAGRSWARGALRQVVVVVGAFAVTYVIGRAVGAAVT